MTDDPREACEWNPPRLAHPVDIVADYAKRRGVTLDPARVAEMRALLDAPAIDYRDLLSRYIAHVVDYNGPDFLSHGAIATKEADFTPAERAELDRMAKEAWDKREKGLEQ